MDKFLNRLSLFPDLSIVIGNKETFVMYYVWLAHRSDEQMLIVLDNCREQATLIADLRRHIGCTEVSRHTTASAILWLGILSLYQWPLGGVGTKAVLKNGKGAREHQQVALLPSSSPFLFSRL